MSSEEGVIAGSDNEYIWDEDELSTLAGPQWEGRPQEEVPAGEEAQLEQGASGGAQPSYQNSRPESIFCSKHFFF